MMHAAVRVKHTKRAIVFLANCFTHRLTQELVTLPPEAFVSCNKSCNEHVMSSQNPHPPAKGGNKVQNKIRVIKNLFQASTVTNCAGMLPRLSIILQVAENVREEKRKMFAAESQERVQASNTFATRFFIVL